MRKGQRPSKHWRRVRTKKGRRKVRINPNIKKKIKKRHTKRRRSVVEKKKTKRPCIKQSISPPPKLAHASPEETLRRIQEQARINALSQFAPFKRIDRRLGKKYGMPPPISPEELAEVEIADEEETEKAADFLKGKEDIWTEKKTSKFASKKIKELISLAKSLNKIEGATARTKFYDKYNLGEKLAKAGYLAEKSKYPGLIDTSRELAGAFDNLMLESRYQEGKMTKSDEKIHKAGKLMLETPFEGHIDLSEHAMTEKEQRQEQKKMTKDMRAIEEYQEKKTKGNKEQIAKQAKSRSELMQATKKASEQAYQDLGLNKEQRKIMGAITKLEETISSSENEGIVEQAKKTQGQLYKRFDTIRKESPEVMEKALREQKRLREQTLVMEKEFKKKSLQEQKDFERQQREKQEDLKEKLKRQQTKETEREAKQEKAEARGELHGKIGHSSPPIMTVQDDTPSSFSKDAKILEMEVPEWERKKKDEIILKEKRGIQEKKEREEKIQKRLRELRDQKKIQKRLRELRDQNEG